MSLLGRKFVLKQDFTPPSSTISLVANNPIFDYKINDTVKSSVSLTITPSTVWGVSTCKIETDKDTIANYSSVQGYTWISGFDRVIEFDSGENAELTNITFAPSEEAFTEWLLANSTEITPIPYIVTSDELISIADAIRSKTGTSSLMAFPSAFVSAIEDIPTGGGSTDGDVVFIDYDGTVVAAKTKAEINAMTSDSELPAFPTHEGLTAQGWNWTVAQLKTQLTAMPDQKVYVGQMYVTTSGATEIDVVMQEGRLDPILTIAVNGTISVDWGDNTTPDSVTGSSLTTQLAVSHTYASAGSYTIKISGSEYSLYCSSNNTILRKNTSANENKTYSNTITKIRLGNSAKISDYAFSNCSSLSSITIPSSVTSIGIYAFNNCYSLSSITIPSGVTSIGNYTFYKCYSLSSITIPNSVTSIGANAFYYCASLSSITVPSGVTSIGNYAFYYCYSLSSITISSSTTSIGNNAFNYCYSLSSITIPSGVTSIGEYAFGSCYSLSNITIPSSVTSISGSVFSSCYSLSSIIIPSDVTSIGANAFSGCISLSSITIPSSVTSIGGNAFSTCYGVSEYHFQRETPPTGGTTIFSSIVSDCVIYVPYSADHSILNAYKTATNWSAYASYMQEEPQ